MFQQTPRKPVLSRLTLSRLRAKQGLALFVFALVAVTGVLATFQPAPISAATSSTLNFQARLENAGGAIVPDGNYNVEFKIYNASTSSGSSQGSCTGDSACLWTETRVSADQVKVINGYLTVNLGSVTPFAFTNWNQQLWLTMRIGGTGTPSWDAEMSPRIQLTAVPYAFQAGELGNGTNRATLDSSGNLTLQQASTISTSTGNLTLQAASALALQSASSTSSSNVTIQSGNASAGNSGNISLDVGTATGTKGSISIGSANPAAAINIGAVGSTANATTLHMADSTGAAQTITIGGTNTSSSTSNATTTVNIQGGATGLKVANGGVTIQTWTDSASAFKVQNAAGSSILTTSTLNLGSWTTNANSLTAVEQEASAISNGYAYVIAGTTTGAAAGGVSTVQYAKVNSDGSVGAWSTTSALPAARSYGPQTAPVWNGYIYYAGGYNTSGAAQSTVYYAKLNADGTVGSWNSTTSLATGGPGAIAEGEMVAANGYLYWIGGYNGTTDVATSYYAKLNADGTVGSWASTGLTLPSNLADFQAVVANGYIYAVGGWGGVNVSNEIYSAKLTSTGALSGTAGNWYTPSTVAANSLPGTGITDASAAVVNGTLYAIGGAAGGGGPGTKVIYGFPLPADGSTVLGNRTTQTGQLAATRWKGSAAVANGYIYYFGGDGGTGSTSSGTVYYSSTTRVSIAGDLDLIGLATSSLSGQSSGGGTIYAGSIHSIGNLSVQGNTSLRNGLSVNGATVIRDSAASTATFQVQNSSSANLFTVDTANNAIILGNDGAPSAFTVRGGTATSSNTTGSSITFDASNGTGVGGSGDFIFRTAGPAATSVTLDRSSSTNDLAGAAANSFTWSASAPAVSAGHNNYLLVVGVTITENAAQTVASVTYNGLSLTKLSAQNCPGTTCRSELWYMVNPTHDGASHNVVVTLSGAQTANYEVGAASYYNVDQTTPLQAAVTSSGTAGLGGAATFTTTGISTTTSQVVIDALASDQAVTNPGTQTVLWNNLSVDAAVSGSKAGTGGTVNYSWTSTSGNWADVTTAINPVTNTSADTLADRLHITAAGSVGINTSNPQHTLDVAGTANITGALTLGTASSATGTLVFNNAGGANTITLQSGTTSASYTLTLPTAVGNSGDCLKASNGTGTLTWGACGGAGAGGVSLQSSTPGTPDTGNFNVSGTGIAGILQANTDSSSAPSLLVGSGANVVSFLSASNRAFFGYDGSNAVIQGVGTKGIKFNVNNSTFGSGTAVTIDTSGNVGIGAASGGRTLDVKGGTLTVATATSYAFGVGNALQGDFTIGSDASNVYLQSWSSKPLEINNQGNNIYLVPSSGNVGIRTTSTSYPLDVNGIIRSSAGVIATGDDNGGSGGQLRVIGGSYGFFLRNDGSNLYLLQTAGGNQYGSWTANRQLIAPVNSDNIYFSNNGGGVGIGTTSVNHTLTVSRNLSGGKVVAFGNFTTTDATNTGILELRGGWASGTAANSRYLQFFDSATNDTNGIGEGSVDARAGGVTYNNSTADFGEYFTLLNPISYGDLVVSGTSNDGTYGVTQATNQNGGIVGVLSDTAGFVGNAKYAADGSLDRANRDVVGFLGQIGTHVSDINGPIHMGDPITVSAIPGYGQKATTAGQIVGRAMADFDPSAGSATIACPAGSPAGVNCGRVKVLVEISWYDPSTEMGSNLQGGNYANLNVTGDLSTYHLTVTGDATFKANIIVDGHVITGGDTPVADPQAAAGIDTLGNVEGACTINGNDTSGTLTLIAGFNNLASGAQCTITFAKPFDSAPRPVVSATDKEAAGVGVYAQTSATQMTLYFSQVPQAGQQYNFNYWNPQ